MKLILSAEREELTRSENDTRTEHLRRTLRSLSYGYPITHEEVLGIWKGSYERSFLVDLPTRLGKGEEVFKLLLNEAFVSYDQEAVLLLIGNRGKGEFKENLAYLVTSPTKHGTWLGFWVEVEEEEALSLTCQGATKIEEKWWRVREVTGYEE